MDTGVFLGLAVFFAMSKAFKIAHSSTSSIPLFFPKNILFSLHLAAGLS